MSKPKHPMPNKISKKISKEVRNGLLEGDTKGIQAVKPKAKLEAKTTKKKVRREERRVSTRTPHADDGTWEKVGESKVLSKARSFAKALLKNSFKKVNKMFSTKSKKR